MQLLLLLLLTLRMVFQRTQSLINCCGTTSMPTKTLHTYLQLHSNHHCMNLHLHSLQLLLLLLLSFTAAMHNLGLSALTIR
jgi:hypothetical protein